MLEVAVHPRSRGGDADLALGALHDTGDPMPVSRIASSDIATPPTVAAKPNLRQAREKYRRVQTGCDRTRRRTLFLPSRESESALPGSIRRLRTVKY
jgi:hypothetical protein